VKLVSIITPSYNSEVYILKAYDSILSQSYSNWEWLVTDDSSDDGSWEILKRLSSKDKRVKIVRNATNLGAAESRNQCLIRAKGEFIAFLDSDDIWLPKKLEKQISFMGEAINFSFTAFEEIDFGGKLLNKTVGIGYRGEYEYQDILSKKVTIGCLTVVLRASSFDEIKFPLLACHEDFALWLKLLRKCKKAHVINEVLAHYRVLPGSLSRNKFKVSIGQWKIYREQEKLNLMASFTNFISYIARGLMKR
jgi:hypothetical protein